MEIWDTSKQLWPAKSEVEILQRALFQREYESEKHSALIPHYNFCLVVTTLPISNDINYYCIIGCAQSPLGMGQHIYG